MNKTPVLLICLLFVLVGCATMTVEERDHKRVELDAMLDESIAAFIEQDSKVAEGIEASVGYAVASMKLTKIPVFGGGGGEAVLVNKASQQRSYYTVSRFDIGGGVGARAFKVLMVFNSQEIINKWKTGKWEFKAGVEASAGTSSAEGSSGGKGFTLYTLSEGGASATVTVRFIRVKLDKGLSESF